jgi:hypothetical protein
MRDETTKEADLKAVAPGISRRHVVPREDASIAIDAPGNVFSGTRCDDAE